MKGKLGNGLDSQYSSHSFLNLPVGGEGPSALCANRFTPGGDQAFPIVLEPVKVTDPVLFLSEIQEVFLVIIAP